MPILTRGERFKDARIVYNQNGKQTMKAVETETGVSASLIKDLEDDKSTRSVGYDKVAALAKHYGVSADYLLSLSDDPAFKPCAVDELGLPHEIINIIREWNDEETELIWSHHGLVLFLQYTLHTPLYELIDGLNDLVQTETNAFDTFELLERLRPAEEWKRNNPSPFGEMNGAWYDDLSHEFADARAGHLLWVELQERYPEFAQRFCVTFGTRNLEPRFNEVCSYFRRYLEDMTGYREYLDNRI